MLEVSQLWMEYDKMTPAEIEKLLEIYRFRSEGWAKDINDLARLALDQARELAAANARIAELVAALQSIAAQELIDEMDTPEGDFEYAYDTLIKIALPLHEEQKP